MLTDLVPSGDPSLGAFIAVMALGFLVGIGGHVYKSKTAVATGIGLIFLSTVVLPLLLYLGED